MASGFDPSACYTVAPAKRPRPGSPDGEAPDGRSTKQAAPRAQPCFLEEPPRIAPCFLQEPPRIAPCFLQEPPRIAPCFLQEPPRIAPCFLQEPPRIAPCFLQEPPRIAPCFLQEPPRTASAAPPLIMQPRAESGAGLLREELTCFGGWGNYLAFIKKHKRLPRLANAPVY